MFYNSRLARCYRSLKRIAAVYAGLSGSCTGHAYIYTRLRKKSSVNIYGSHHDDGESY